MKQSALGVAQVLINAGYRALFAGGCVRDSLLENNVKDYDIATNARPEEVQKLFVKSQAVGVAFGVVLVFEGGYTFEVATFRGEDKYTDGRHPECVWFTDEKEDVKRRDFTINGLLQDPITGEILDYVGGVDDIKNRVLRCIGEPKKRFEEDYLRLLRLVRFAARLGFEIEEQTLLAAKNVASEILCISVERIREELTNMLCGKNPQVAFVLLNKLGLLKVILPEVASFVNCTQPVEFHPEGDVFNHTHKMLENMGEADLVLAWGVLLHDVGKPKVREVIDERIRFFGHDGEGAKIAKEICNRLKFSKNDTRLIVALVKNHMKFLEVKNMKRSTLLKMFAQEGFERHLALHRLDCVASSEKYEFYEFCKEELSSLSKEDITPLPLLRGNDLFDLGVKKGRAVGQTLKALREAQLNKEIKNSDEARAWVLARVNKKGEDNERGES